MSDDRVVAVGLLTKAHLVMLKEAMPKVLPLPQGGQFDDLLEALDELGRKQAKE